MQHSFEIHNLTTLTDSWCGDYVTREDAKKALAEWRVNWPRNQYEIRESAAGGDTTEYDAEFTPCCFGGGWLKPNTQAGHDLALESLGVSGEPEWPEGHIVEPYQLDELIESAQSMGVTVDGLPSRESVQ